MATAREVCVVDVGLDSDRLDSRRIFVDALERVIHEKPSRVGYEVQYLSEVHLTSVFVGDGRIVERRFVRRRGKVRRRTLGLCAVNDLIRMLEVASASYQSTRAVQIGKCAVQAAERTVKISVELLHGRHRVGEIHGWVRCCCWLNAEGEKHHNREVPIHTMAGRRWCQEGCGRW